MAAKRYVSTEPDDAADPAEVERWIATQPAGAVRCRSEKRHTWKPQRSIENEVGHYITESWVCSLCGLPQLRYMVRQGKRLIKVGSETLYNEQAIDPETGKPAPRYLVPAGMGRITGEAAQVVLAAAHEYNFPGTSSSKIRGKAAREADMPRIVAKALGQGV